MLECGLPKCTEPAVALAMGFSLCREHYDWAERADIFNAMTADGGAVNLMAAIEVAAERR